MLQTLSLLLGLNQTAIGSYKKNRGNKMIVKEFYRTREDGVKLYKSYSDSGFIIRKQGTDEEYDVAIDVEDSANIYTETNKAIEEIE